MNATASVINQGAWVKATALVNKRLTEAVSLWCPPWLSLGYKYSRTTLLSRGSSILKGFHLKTLKVSIF